MLKRAVIALITLSCVTLAWQAEAARFYRYINAEGLEEISHTIPNDRVALGYDVLDANMRLVEHVARQLSPEEIVTRNRQQSEEAVCLTSQKRVRALYESEEDITQAEEQALDSLTNRITNAQANLAQLRNQHRALEEEAARMDRAGQSLTSIVLGNIDRAKAQIENLEGEIAQRKVEKEETRRQHAVDLEVFRRSECLVASVRQPDV
ncbi:MAG: hypothetical protein E2O59_13365 [Gammaproteobacteria bacterium]|nr:MAG: hypothetical protein E2O59_13365 [Gammaproteobacteria bacterium]